MIRQTGTIVLPTASACAIFTHELVGQFSDGMWENTGPHDHWEFWAGLETRVATGSEQPWLESDKKWLRKKKGYNIASLYDIVGDRMLLIGRMALAAAKVGHKMTDDDAFAAEFLESYAEGFKSTPYVEERIQKVPQAVVEAFYQTTYTMKDLKKDVKAIKLAMKS